MKAIVKFNGGNLALLCSKCRVIIKTGVDFTHDEIEFAMGKIKLSPRYCENCNKILTLLHERGTNRAGETTG